MHKAQQIKPGTEGQVIKTVNGNSTYANHALTSNDKDMAPTQTTSGDDFRTDLTISRTPAGDGHVKVLVNGLQQVLGDFDDSKDCYFADSTETWDKVSGGRGFHALLFNRTAWGWGDGASGRLGNNSNQDRSSPVSVVGNHVFDEVKSAGLHVLYRKRDGTVWGNGSNATGGLGTNNTTNRSSPVSVVGNHSFVAIVAGMNFTASDGISGGRKADGSVWMWGANDFGVIGDNSGNDRSSPVSVVGTHSFIFLFCAEETALALKADGSCWGWGAGADGQLGQGTVANSRSSPVSVIGSHSFIRVASGGTTADSGFSVGLKADGSAWGWGDNGSGQLGTNNGTNRSSPVSVVGGHSFIDLTAASGSGGGSNFVMALKADGSAWGWGDGSSGRLGQHTVIADRSSPVSVAGSGNLSFTKITCAVDSVAGMTSNGVIWAWGVGTSGEMGNNEITSRSSPVSTISVGGVRSSTYIRSIANIQAGDMLIWNGTTAGFELGTSDKVDFDYIS